MQNNLYIKLKENQCDIITEGYIGVSGVYKAQNSK